MYTRGAFSNRGGRGRGRGHDETPLGQGHGQSWDRGRGRDQGGQGGYATSRDRGGTYAPRDGANSWGRGRGDQGHREFDATRGGLGGGDRGRGRGRGRGGTWEGFSDQEQAEILTTRLSTMQISSEGTDDVIVPSTTGVPISLAMSVLGQNTLDALRTSQQMRLFLQSCLLNLSNHHSVDTSGVLYGLASEKGLDKLRHIMRQPVSIEASNEISSGKVSFQNVILPLIGVLTRQSICQTTLTQESNLIFGLVQENSQQFLGTSVLTSIHSLLCQDFPPASVSTFSVFSSLSSQHNPNHENSLEAMAPLHCALLAIVRLFYQLVMRFPCSDPQMLNLIKKLTTLVKICLQQKKTGHSQVVYLNSALLRDTKRLLGVVKDRTFGRQDSGTQPVQAISSTSSSSLSGPGELALHGPRHDNDHTLIDRIDVLPTIEEVLCRDEPYLPINDTKESTTHFLSRGWSRHLDIHFRLYRQDMLKPLCASIQEFVKVLGRTDKHDDRTFTDPRELKKLISGNVGLNVYSNVKFEDVSVEGFQAGQITISFDQPMRIKGVAAYQDRREFWERSRGRLMQSGLVCMVRRGPQVGHDNRDVQAVLAIVQERDIRELSKSEGVAFIQVSLMNTKSYMAVFTPSKSNECWFMIECPGSFLESYRPVLKALQTKMPSTLPLRKYIAPTDKDIADILSSSSAVAIDPPRYATTPGFKFDLSILLENGATCELNVKDISLADRAVAVLRKHSSLDSTQALALVETLGREIALINGPPGTGKTKIGVDLMRVLLHNKQATNSGPILVICYTNHALDQFLEHIVAKGYTKIVRLGSQSKSQILQEYNLKSMMGRRTKPYAARRVLAEAFEVSDRAAQNIQNLTLALKSGYFEWEYVREYLSMENPAQCLQFEVPPLPVVWRNEDDEELLPSRSYLGGTNAYERWATGKDIIEKRLWNQHVDDKNRKGARSTNIFASLVEDSNETVATRRYEIPLAERPLSLLSGDVWSMSMVERRRLIESWSPEIIRSIEEELEQHHQSLKDSEERKYSGYDELRRLIMSGMDVIGMTTSGSAKYHKLLESVAPKIVMCEEAGEVLESHILTALSSCTQHLILIGDHLQLRPQIQTFGLSSESSDGRKYNLDRSLFERLVTSKPNPLPMSCLTIQRRMRPEISSLIRNTLYPTLEDGGPVHHYPDVGGMGANLFFMNHSHPEDKKDPFGPQSFANKFEVDMIEALALYLIKNGYNQPGDIAILTPYLGQLVKIRDKLKDKCVVLVDERDQETLDELGAEGAARTSKGTQSSNKSQQNEVELQNHLTIRTIDNYQGEEAKIIIVSLVRSDISTEGETLSGSIGFLKSPNRTNVLLSRAQHGMFLVGNARLMAQPKHGIWPAVIGELTETGRLDSGFPIACKNHPETRRVISSPENLQALAPDGGCTLPCGGLLKCGHICPRSCHPDDPQHILVKCREPCPRPRAGCDHACQRRCWEDCGDCNVIVSPLRLPCGHVLHNPKCYQSLDPSQVLCTANVDRTLVSCGHTRTMRCHQDPTKFSCTAKCSAVLECGHPCNSICHDSSPCPSCSAKCSASCTHTSCKHDCQTLCKLCCLDCAWECKHRGKCTLPCSAPCSRLPCDERCDKDLPCGHQCPSVCGERCPSIEFCPECCEPSVMKKVYGSTGIRHLFEMDASKDPILVPPCGHTLTMKVLDELMGLDRYRHEQNDEEWDSIYFNTFKDVNDCPRSHIECHVCFKPIGASFFRYGRSVKHKQLLDLMDKFRNTSYKETIVVDKQQCLDTIHYLTSTKDTLVHFLSMAKATPCPVWPSSTDKRVKVQDGVLVGDLGEISLLYRISWRHQAAWTSAIEPVKDVLALLGQSVAEQPPLSEITTILVNRSRVPVQDTFRNREDTRAIPLQASRNTSTAPTKEEMARALRILGLENVVGIDRAVKQSQQLNPGICSLIMTSVYNLAFDAMKAAGADSGWYWFVGDLLKCCQEYNHQFKAMAHDRSDQSTFATQFVLEGFSLKMNLLTARPLAGLRSIDEFKKVVQEAEQEFYAEVSELRRGGSGNGLGTKHEAMVSRIEKELEGLLQRTKQQDDVSGYSVLDYEREW